MKLDILWTENGLYSHSSYFETWISIIGIGEIKLSVAKAIMQDFWTIYINYDSSVNYESYIFWNCSKRAKSTSRQEIKQEAVDFFNEKFNEFKNKILNIEGAELIC